MLHIKLDHLRQAYSRENLWDQDASFAAYPSAYL